MACGRPGQRQRLTATNGFVFGKAQVLSIGPTGSVTHVREPKGEQNPATNPPGLTVPGYATLDLMGEYQFSERYVLKVNVTNARKHPVKVELKIPYKLKGKPGHVTQIDGIPTWRVTVPANGEADLEFQMPLGT